MFKKLTELRSELESDRQRLEVEIANLELVIEKPEPKPFDEQIAARRLTAVKTDDHLNGTRNAEKVAKEIDKDREASLRQYQSLIDERKQASDQIKLKQAKLSAITSEAQSIKNRIKGMIDSEAQSRLDAAIQCYQDAANAMINALIDFDALTAVLDDNPHDRFFKKIAQVGTLPLLQKGTESGFNAPLELRDHGGDLFMTDLKASAAVRSRYEQQLANIKEALSNA